MFISALLEILFTLRETGHNTWAPPFWGITRYAGHRQQNVDPFIMFCHIVWDIRPTVVNEHWILAVTQTPLALFADPVRSTVWFSPTVDSGRSQHVHFTAYVALTHWYGCRRSDLSMSDMPVVSSSRGTRSRARFSQVLPTYISPPFVWSGDLRYTIVFITL